MTKHSITSKTLVPLKNATADNSIGGDSAFTNALAALTACEARREGLSAVSVELEHCFEFQAAADACGLAWDAVVACANAFAARRVYQFIQEHSN